jgi:uncharacterized protein YjiS (DUF1127 family)
MAALLSRGIVQLQKNVIFLSAKGMTNQNALRNEKIRKDVQVPDTIRIRHAALLGPRADLYTLLSLARERFEDYMLYRRSVSELSELSGRELADLGLHRSEIKRVAYETVYGQRS